MLFKLNLGEVGNETGTIQVKMSAVEAVECSNSEPDIAWVHIGKNSYRVKRDMAFDKFMSLMSKL